MPLVMTLVLEQDICQQQNTRRLMHNKAHVFLTQYTRDKKAWGDM